MATWLTLAWARDVCVLFSPYFWFKFERPEKFSEANPDKMMVGATVPVIARFQSIRVAAALIGPGLPTAGTTATVERAPRR